MNIGTEKRRKRERDEANETAVCICNACGSNVAAEILLEVCHKNRYNFNPFGSKHIPAAIGLVAFISVSYFLISSVFLFYHDYFTFLINRKIYIC